MATPYVMVTRSKGGQKITHFSSKAAAHKAGNAARAAGADVNVHSVAHYNQFIKPPSGRSAGSPSASSSSKS